MSNYGLIKQVGRGSCGKVLLAEHKLTGHQVAVKVLTRSQLQEKNMEDKVRQEINIMRMLDHPHVIKLYDVIETPTFIYMVIEYAK